MSQSPLPPIPPIPLIFLVFLIFPAFLNQPKSRRRCLQAEFTTPPTPRLVALRVRSHNLSREYNGLDETDPRRQRILQGWLDLQGENVFLQGPVQFDYGCFTSIGENSYANFNFTCLDCCPMTIGRNVFIGPNVSLLTPVHPLRFQDRNLYRNARGQMTDHEYAKPIVISDNCWIAGNVTVCGGVTIGEGCVIGAGSVVTRDIPSGMVAFGDPCRPIRPITEEDGMSDLFEAE